MAFLGVPIATVRTALKIDSGESDELLSIYISDATLAILRYLKLPYDFSLGNSPADSPPNSPPDDLTLIDPRIQLAIIKLVGVTYKQPDSDDAKNYAVYGTLPNFVTSHIYSERTPTLA